MNGKTKKRIGTLDAISRIFCQATKEVLETGSNVAITFSPTIQKVPAIHLRPDIGCFVQFDGDYSGLFIMNFSAAAALELYRSSMLYMGLTEDDLATEFTSDEVVDSIGEMINQIIGKARKMIESQYWLSAVNSQPKAIALTSTISLSVEAGQNAKELCRRLSFRVSGKPFYIEFSFEKTEFTSMDGSDVHALDDENAGQFDFDEIKKATVNNTLEEQHAVGNAGIDFDSLKKATEVDFDSIKSSMTEEKAPGSGNNFDFDSLKNSVEPSKPSGELDFDALKKQIDTPKKITPNDEIDFDALKKQVDAPKKATPNDEIDFDALQKQFGEGK